MIANDPPSGPFASSDAQNAAISAWLSTQHDQWRVNNQGLAPQTIARVQPKMNVNPAVNAGSGELSPA
jgi:hypothetical protein